MSLLLPILAADLALALLGIVFALLIWVSWTDIRFRLIRNTPVIAIALLFAPFAWLAAAQLPSAWFSHVGTALVLFVFTFFCFTRGWMGGGDAKLIPAIGLWVGPHGVLPFLLMTALGGVVVAVALVAMQSRREKLTIGAARKLPLPYGVAIAAGGMWVTGFEYAPKLLALVL